KSSSGEIPNFLNPRVSGQEEFDMFATTLDDLHTLGLSRREMQVIETAFADRESDSPRSRVTAERHFWRCNCPTPSRPVRCNESTEPTASCARRGVRGRG